MNLLKYLGHFDFKIKRKELYKYIYIYIYISVNRIQNKSFCLHNIGVFSVYIYYVYINTHTAYILKTFTRIYL